MTESSHRITDATNNRNRGLTRTRTHKAFQGAWRGVDILGQRAKLREEGEHDLTPSSHSTGCWASTKRRYPRTYSLFFMVIVPLFLMVFLCFGFGAALARLEYGAEMEANEALNLAFADLFFSVEELERDSLSSPEECLASYEFGEVFNKTDLEVHMKECGQELLREQAGRHVDFLRGSFDSQQYDMLSFDWMACRNSTLTFYDHDSQARYIVDEFKKEYFFLREKYQAENMTRFDAHVLAKLEASGSSTCKPDWEAGALFWFTVMTTIGYGNAAPTTPGGRYMVYTLGFCSILLFTALVGQAGSVVLTVADDAFLRWKHTKRLTQGLLSCVFWLCMLLLWMLALSGIFIGWAKNRMKADENLSDAYWFTFISTTTVGLGDLYIPHEVFEWRDLLYIPLLFLFAFVFLGTFLLKFSIMVASWFPQKEDSLEEILHASRERQANEESSHGVEQVRTWSIGSVEQMDQIGEVASSSTKKMDQNGAANSAEEHPGTTSNTEGQK